MFVSFPFWRLSFTPGCETPFDISSKSEHEINCLHRRKERKPRSFFPWMCFLSFTFSKPSQGLSSTGHLHPWGKGQIRGRLAVCHHNSGLQPPILAYPPFLLTLPGQGREPCSGQFLQPSGLSQRKREGAPVYLWATHSTKQHNELHFVEGSLGPPNLSQMWLFIKCLIKINDAFNLNKISHCYWF